MWFYGDILEILISFLENWKKKAIWIEKGSLIKKFLKKKSMNI